MLLALCDAGYYVFGFGAQAASKVAQTAKQAAGAASHRASRSDDNAASNRNDRDRDEYRESNEQKAQ